MQQQKIKELTSSSIGLRDCIKSLRERFKWSWGRFFSVLILNYFSIIFSMAFFGFDLYTDVDFSLHFFNQSGRNFNVEIGECRPEFEVRLNKTVQFCLGFPDGDVRSNLMILRDDSTCLRRLQDVRHFGDYCFNKEQRFETSENPSENTILPELLLPFTVFCL